MNKKFEGEGELVFDVSSSQESVAEVKKHLIETEAIIAELNQDLDGIETQMKTVEEVNEQARQYGIKEIPAERITAIEDSYKRTRELLAQFTAVKMDLEKIIAGFEELDRDIAQKISEINSKKEDVN
jgi:chromosome segregation ATPase